MVPLAAISATGGRAQDTVFHNSVFSAGASGTRTVPSPLREHHPVVHPVAQDFFFPMGHILCLIISRLTLL